MNDIQPYLVVASILFSLGVFAVITRRNAIAILMGIELILKKFKFEFWAVVKFIG